MKLRMVLSLAAFLAIAGTGHAQMTMVRPAPGGGYNAFGPNGGLTMIRPAPGGGYNQFNPNGSMTMIRPAPGGGYNVFGPPPQPPRFGYPSYGGYGNNMGGDDDN